MSIETVFSTSRPRGPTSIMNQKATSIAHAVNHYMEHVVYPVCTQFFVALVEPRGNHGFFNITPDNARRGFIQTPHFSETMADYVIQHILPLGKLVGNKMVSEDVKSIFYTENEAAMRQCMTTFTNQLSDYKDAFRSMLMDNPLLVHPMVDARGNPVLDAKGEQKQSIFLMTRAAAQKIITAKYLLIDYLSLNPEVENEESAEQEIMKLSSYNSLLLSGTGLPQDMERCLHAFLWVLSSVIDWLETEAVYPEDVLAAARLAMPFVDQPDTINELVKPMTNSESLEDRIYQIITGYDLYISEQALHMIIGWMNRLRETPDLLSQTLAFSHYYV